MKKTIVLLSFILLSFSGWSQHSSGQQQANHSKVKVFPNPATSVVNVLNLKNTDRADITISNLYGATLLSHQWKIKNNALNIPVSSLEPGIYVITIRSKEQNLQTKFYKK